MKHYPEYKIETINDLQPGDCFAIRVRDAVSIALAIIPAREGRPHSFVVLSPPHPGWNEVGVLEGAGLRSSPIIKFPGARIILPQTAAGFSSVSKQLEPAGALVLSPEGLGVVARLNDYDRVVFDVATGEVMNSSPTVEFHEWSIALPDAAGELQTLCTITASMGQPS